MKKLLIIFAILFCASCELSCSRFGAWNVTSDEHANKMQQMMSHVVIVWDHEKTKDDEVHRFNGTGTVIEVNEEKKRSLITTAGHVCEITLKDVVSRELFIVNIEGDLLPATVLYMNSDTDMCVLMTKGIAGVPVKIADNDPPHGARVLTINASSSNFWRHHSTMHDGYFSGRTPDYGWLVLSMPAAPGASGGPVFYRDEVFATIVRIEGRYGNITYCSTLNSMNDAMKEARNHALWRD